MYSFKTRRDSRDQDGKHKTMIGIFFLTQLWLHIFLFGGSALCMHLFLFGGMAVLGEFLNCTSLESSRSTINTGRQFRFALVVTSNSSLNSTISSVCQHSEKLFVPVLPVFTPAYTLFHFLALFLNAFFS